MGFGISSQLETAMVFRLLVSVVAFALVSDYEQQTFSAMFVYFAPPRRLECVRFWLSCICARIRACVYLYLFACVSVSICISVALAHVLCAVRPKSCHCSASNDWEN